MDGWLRRQTIHLRHTVHYCQCVDSTQAEAKRLAAMGAAVGTVVVAEEQTAGRGRLGREWLSPKGNLHVTVWLRPALPMAEWPQLTMIAALAIAQELELLGARSVALKWPNDVLIDGHKAAGILAEVQDSDLFLGFGLNVNAPLPPELAQATSVAREVQREVDLGEILTAIVVQFDSYYDALLKGRRFTQEWARRLVTLGRDVDVTSAGQAFCGVAESVTDDGALLVRRTDGTLESFRAADVTLRVALRQVPTQPADAMDAEAEAAS